MGPAATTTVQLGATGLEVTRICAGAAQLGDLVEAIGYTVPEERARRTVLAILDGPLTFLDTAGAYGDGISERRIGEAIREYGGLPAGFVLATKAGMDHDTFDFSGDQARRSVDRSLRLLGMSSLPLVYLHDPESCHQSFEELTGPGGALEALLALRDDGVIGHVGIAGTDLEETDRYLATGAFSVAITHNKLTLLDRSAEPWLEGWAQSVAVLNAAPYAGGVLSRGLAHGRYMYHRSIPPAISERVTEIERICSAFEVPVAAVALQFSLGHAAISSTIVGMSSPERVAETLELATIQVPPAVWDAVGVTGLAQAS